MSTIVQKYGGSSVATPALLKRVAARVAATRALGHSVVVVVSAMGNTTDELLGLARSVSANPSRRELDMMVTVGERISMALLSMAIQDLGQPAVSFTGSQSGIITTDNHTNARILRVTPYRIQQALEAGRVVIVAGFQGVSVRKEITSLGRGGSDTTAIALAAALGAEYAEICSDVDGVYSADPRIVPDARRLDDVSYEEMQTLSDAGAKVLNAEAVEWARRQGIEVRCVASASAPETAGTRIDAGDGLEKPRVVGVTRHKSMLFLEGGDASALPAVRALLARHGAADADVLATPGGWSASIPTANLHGRGALREALEATDGVRFREDVTWVTVVGRALGAPPSRAEAAARALADAGIEVLGRGEDAGRARFLVPVALANEAVDRIHETLFD